PLAELYLEAVVAIPTAVIDQSQAPRDVWIEHEEVDRIGARRVESGIDSGTRAESIAEHAADVVLVSGQSIGESASLTVLKVRDKGSRAIPGASRDGCHSAPGPEGSVKDRQSYLARSTKVLEAVHSRSLVDCQVLLRVLEFLEEPVLKDIDFVHIAGAPDEMRLIADISDLEYVILSELALDA